MGQSVDLLHNPRGGIGRVSNPDLVWGVKCLLVLVKTLEIRMREKPIVPRPLAMDAMRAYRKAWQAFRRCEDLEKTGRKKTRRWKYWQSRLRKWGLVEDRFAVQMYGPR